MPMSIRVGACTLILKKRISASFIKRYQPRWAPSSSLLAGALLAELQPAVLEPGLGSLMSFELSIEEMKFTSQKFCEEMSALHGLFYHPESAEKKGDPWCYCSCSVHQAGDSS